MDAFDFAPDDDEDEDDSQFKMPSMPAMPKVQFRPKFNIGDLLWNLGTLYFVGMTVVLAGVFILILINPQVSFNPWKPIALPPVATTLPGSDPTATTVPIIVGGGEEETPVVVDEPTATDVVPEDDTPTDIPPSSGMPYILQSGSPIFLPSVIYQPDLACNFLGIGGQAFDFSGTPVVGYAVQVSGTLDGAAVELLTFTGGAVAYGLGGYEILIADSPAASSGTMVVQLFDLDFNPVSDQIPFDTVNDCEQNVTLLNFIES
jgi:hypothetical protein